MLVITFLSTCSAIYLPSSQSSILYHCSQHPYPSLTLPLPPPSAHTHGTLTIHVSIYHLCYLITHPSVQHFSHSSQNPFPIPNPAPFSSSSSSTHSRNTLMLASAVPSLLLALHRQLPQSRIPTLVSVRFMCHRVLFTLSTWMLCRPTWREGDIRGGEKREKEKREREIRREE